VGTTGPDVALRQVAALDAERRAHDDDAVYSSYIRRRKGPERP
jgi:hypothetical protein